MKRLLCTLFLVPGLCVADPVTIRADEWYPMNGEPGAQLAGFMIDLAERAFGEIDYKIMPWERALADVEAGLFDCVVGAYKDDAPNFVFPSENWGLDSTVAYVVENDAWKADGPASLLARKVGYIKGYSYSEEIDAYIEKNVPAFKGRGVSGNDALSKNIQKLVNGRIDTIIESPLVMNAKLKAMNLKGKVISAGIVGDESEMFIACSPAKESSKALVKKVDEVTQALRKTGELKAIMEKYGLDDWK